MMLRSYAGIGECGVKPEVINCYMIAHSASTERCVISASKVASREPSRLRCGQPLLNRCQPRGSRHRSEAKKKGDSLELEASSTRYVRKD